MTTNHNSISGDISEKISASQHEKCSELLMICEVVGHNFKTGCQFYLNGINLMEYHRLHILSEMHKRMEDRNRKCK
jgi:hypothetical protein